LPISAMKYGKSVKQSGSVSPQKSQEIGPGGSELLSMNTNKEWTTYVTPSLFPSKEEKKEEETPNEDEADVGVDDPITLGGTQQLLGELEDAEEEERKVLSQLPNDGVHPANPEDEDSVEEFLLMFFDLVPEPTDRQVHLLALSLGWSPSELEDKVYSMLSRSAESELDEFRDREEKEEFAEDIPTEGDDDFEMFDL